MAAGGSTASTPTGWAVCARTGPLLERCARVAFKRAARAIGGDMTKQTEAYAAVRDSVTVPLAPPAAFEFFTERLAEWWPLESHHILQGDAGTAVIEPRGRPLVRDRCRRPRVRLGPGPRLRAAEPPPFRLAAHPGVALRSRPGEGHRGGGDPPGRGEGPRVTLEHRGFEVHGKPGAAMRDEVGGDGGWSGLLDGLRTSRASARRSPAIHSCC